jgi:uncharacterized protein
MPRYFFDTSALVKHYHVEAGTNVVDRVVDEAGAELLIARLTLVEIISAFRSTGSLSSIPRTHRDG